MGTLAKPLHVGIVNGRPLRFFRAPIGGTHLPWHAFDDMQVCLDMPEGLRDGLRRDLMAAWARDVRTVATIDGIVTIAPHWMASGLAAAVAEIAGGSHGVTVAYQQALFSAWTCLTGDMPASESMGLLQAAMCNMLAERAGGGPVSGGSGAA